MADMTRDERIALYRENEELALERLEKAKFDAEMWRREILALTTQDLKISPDVISKKGSA
jgi:hypothetical protein